MSAESGSVTTRLEALDAPTLALIQLAAAIAGGSEAEVRTALTVASDVPPRWIDELILQSYLFSGFPRALNAAREWRRASGRPAPSETPGAPGGDPEEWRRRGEETCARVYGEMYDRLRPNIARLHPALDDWMIVDGYGKVLSRPGLDLRRRELCIVAACAALAQDRQLHSHLHGARNVGAADAEVEGALDAITDLMDEDHLNRARRLWSHVRGR